jgi:hypothetical protein
MKPSLLTVCLLVGILVFFGCKKNDPCEAARQTSADFKIIQPFRGYPAVVTDSVTDGTTVIFRAIDTTAESYLWTIGGTTQTWTSRSFSLFFPQQYRNYALPVQLIIRRKPDASCYPMDTGVDTVRRMLYFRLDSVATFYGEWTGFDDRDPQKIYAIRIGYKWANFSQQPYDLIQEVLIDNNLNYGCTARIDIFSGGGSWTPNCLFGGEGSNCPAGVKEGRAFRAYVNGDNILIDYTIYDISTGKEIEKGKIRFRGTRKS